jgi:hypothetical protein
MGAMLAKRAQRDSKHVCGRASHAHASVGMAPVPHLTHDDFVTRHLKEWLA